MVCHTLHVYELREDAYLALAVSLDDHVRVEVEGDIVQLRLLLTTVTTVRLGG